MNRLDPKLLTIAILSLGFAMVLLLGCGDAKDSGAQDEGDFSMDDDSPDDIGQNGDVSDCGGFIDGDSKAGESDAEDDRREKLIWEYDPSSHTVAFLNKNVCLNCCGRHSIEIVLDQTGTYEIRETDKPDDGRCLCDCFYDFRIELNVSTVEVGKEISVRLTRHITDSGPRFEVWSGTIDLGEGSGEIVISQGSGFCI